MQHTLTDVVIRPCEAEERGGVSPSSSPRALALKHATADLARNNDLLKKAVERQLALIKLSWRSTVGADALNGSVASGWATPTCDSTSTAAMVGRAFGSSGKAWF